MPKGFLKMSKSSGWQIYEGDLAQRWYWQTMSRNGFVWKWFFRIEIVGDTRFRSSLSYKEDFIWLLDLAPGIRRVCENHCSGYFYRATEGSLSRHRRSAKQCYAFLSALNDIWQKYSIFEDPEELSDVISTQVRNSANYDVIEWIEKGNKGDADDIRLVRSMYRRLEDTGRRRIRWQQHTRYCFVFWLWRKTGLLFPMRIVVTLFAILRAVRDTACRLYKKGKGK